MLAHLPCWSWLKGYNSNMWRNDVKAGLTVGIMLVPQGMAYATARGVVESLVKEWQEIGLSFCLSGAIGPVRDAMAADGLLEHPHVRVHLTIPQALEDFRHPGSVRPSLQTMAKQHG